MKPIKLTIATSLTAVMVSSAVSAETYTFSGWLPPSHVLTRGIMSGWAEDVWEASGGDIDFEVFTGEALLPALGTLQGIGSGVAHAGHVAALYHPSELPHAVIVGEFGHQMPDPMIVSFAYLDYIMNEESANAEWRRNGVLPSATVSTEPYYYMCSGNVNTLADLRGKRVRAPGAGWARFSEHINMTAVNVAASELYTAMERGAVDCVLADLTQLTSGSSILDLTDSIIMMSLGPAYTASHVTYNLEFWRSLTDEQRRMLFDVNASAMARTLIMYHDEAQAALEEARERGVEIVEPDEALKTAYNDWVDDGIGGLVELSEDRYQIAGAQDYFDKGQQYIDKWKGLMDDVNRGNVDAVAEVIKVNLFDKIDVSTYGMN